MPTLGYFKYYLCNGLLAKSKKEREIKDGLEIKKESKRRKKSTARHSHESKIKIPPEDYFTVCI